MRDQSDRRGYPRLKLNYPIEARVRESGEVGTTRAVTTNLGARGAYFKTFAWEQFRVGQRVAVRVLVPHSMTTGERQIELDMRTDGRVLRLDHVQGREGMGEDGVPLKGVAVKFSSPLEFRYLWS